MGVIEWDGFLDVKFDDLSSEDKETLCESLVECRINSDASKRELKKVLNLAQVLLNFRGDQVEKLREEVEEVGEKHEATQEKLQLEISELQQQANAGKKSRRAAEARQEAARLQRQNRDLQTEIESLRKQQHKTDLMADVEEEEDRTYREQKKLNKTVELQTGHISQLLADLEKVEAENAVFKDKLANVRDKLVDATEALSQSTSELTSARNLCLEYKGKCSELQAESEALRLQVSELVTQRSQLDQQLQEFRQAVDSRVDRWKILMNNKDAEITELRAKLLVSQPDQTTHLQETISALNQAIATRDVQIEELSSRLDQATNELSECATTLEQITHNKSDEESLRVWQQLQAALERERIMEGRLRETEQDASLRAQEVTSLSNELRKLELGELGLPEALTEIRELRKALGVRDIDIEKLVKANNALQTKFDESADQIFALRDQAGLGSEDEIDVSSVNEHREEQRRRTEALQAQVTQLEAERLSLKLQIREVQRHSHSGDVELKLETVQEEEIGAEMQALLEENESLRKGMHEILESVRSQDGISEVKLESACLERLLEALDARHIAGWYHPAMRLQAQLHSTQGIAAELREQLRIAREQEQTLRQELVKTQIPTIMSTKAESHSPQSSPSHVGSVQPQKQSGEWSSSMRGHMHDILDLMSKLQDCMPPLASTWQEQVSQVEEKLGDMSAEVEELKRHLEEGDHSMAVCAARAASQRLAERKALRKCHSLAAAHARVSAQNVELVSKTVKREAQLATEIVQLRETEADLKSQVNQLQVSLTSSVPSEELKSCQASLESTSEKLRDTLLHQDSWAHDEEAIQNVQTELQNSQTQVQTLQEQLAKERSLVKALEAQAQHIELDHQLSALAEKLVAAEQNEEASKLKAEHESKMCNLLREQVRELDERRQQLEKSVLSHYSVPALVFTADETLPQLPQHQIDEGRCARLEEALSAAQLQVTTLQSLVDARHIELETLREQVTQLQEEGDLQATIGRMSEELLSLRLAEIENKNQVAQAQRTSAHLQSRCFHLEHELKLTQLSATRLSMNTQNVQRRLRHKLLELCLRHRACVPLDTLELACRWLHEARTQAREACRLKAKNDLENLTPHDALQNGESSDEKSWHARFLQLRAKNYEIEHQVQRFKRLLEEQTQRADKLDTHAQQLEDERLQLETHWQQELITWQLEHCYGSEEITKVFPQTQAEDKKDESLIIEDIEEEKQDFEKPDESKHEIETSQPSMKETKKSSEEELKSVATTMDSSLKRQSVLHSEIEALRAQLKNREELIVKQKSQLAQNSGTGQRTKLALEAMVSSLSELVSLKEAALGRARQRLREAHAEHANVARALRQQAVELRDSLAKAKAATSSPEVPVQEGGALTRLLTQVHELEDELRVANRGAGVLAGQLRAANGEAQRWRDLAETRQARLQKLQERYEAEVEEAVSARLSKPSAWIEKGDIETAEKDINPELLKARQESTNLRQRLSHCEEEIISLQKQLEETKGDGDVKKGFRETQERRAAQEKMRSQLKQLQMELEESRAKQQAALNLHKQHTNEGVSRWEERKKLQANVDRLKVRVQTLESETEQTQRSNDALRSLVERLERDKVQLEIQLRKKSRTATIASNAPLQAEITRLRERLSSSEDACSGLRRQLEHQRRLAEDGTRQRDEVTKLRRELEHEKEINLTLQGRNTRLEAANLEISIRLESMRNEMHRESEDDGVSREELQRSVLALGQHIRKLQAKLRARGAASVSLDSSLESPHGSEVSARLHSNKRKTSLENELVSVRAENAELSTRLQQKVAVLVEVRAALQEASLREAALTAEVASLRSLL